ncbi:MAG TPA: hypothetical protein VHV77_11400, partial [Pirellulales bacterium]|nr:hypothetical protein [Pirellulales bacterium]
MSQSESIDFQPTVPIEGDIESTVAEFIQRAVDMRASDLFFMSNENHVGVWVRFLGSMVEMARVSGPDGRRCMNHIKAMASIDLAEHRRSLDGRWIFYRDGNK